MFDFKWRVKQVIPQEDYTLILVYKNGKKRYFDCKTLFNKKYAERLKNLDFFMTAKADHDTVMWTEDLDLCPEYLFENSIKI